MNDTVVAIAGDPTILGREARLVARFAAMEERRVAAGQAFVHLEVTCDGNDCSQSVRRDTVRQLAIDTAGWKIGTVDGGPDLCPKCGAGDGDAEKNVR